MPEISDADRRRADADALEWLVALQDAPDDAEVRSRFEGWRKKSPANATAWEESAEVYAAIGETLPLHSERWETLTQTRDRTLAPPIAAAIRNRARPVSGTPRQRRGARPGTKFAKIALPAAAAAILAIAAAPELALRWQADAVTGTGELRTLTLADGTRASLSAGSAITIDYSTRERRITLLRGKAWFEVQDEHRPFRVAARDVETTDIGTAFEVALGDESVEVAVGHGIVRVDDMTSARMISERLTAGDAVSVGTDGQVRHTSGAPELIGAWRDGQLAVQNRPMREVIEALRPWHAGMILVRSDTLASKRVTGVYDLHDPAGAMEALSRAYGGTITRLTPWVLILSDG